MKARRIWTGPESAKVLLTPEDARDEELIDTPIEVEVSLELGKAISDMAFNFNDREQVLLYLKKIGKELATMGVDRGVGIFLYIVEETGTNTNVTGVAQFEISDRSKVALSRDMLKHASALLQLVSPIDIQISNIEGGVLR